MEQRPRRMNSTCLVALALIAFLYSTAVFNVIVPWHSYSVQGAAHLLVLSATTGLGLYCFLACCLVDPGQVPPGWQPEAEAASAVTLEVKRGGGHRYCSKCEAYKPPRTHHCRRCRRCVLRMDHHCIWVNNCVGHGNHRTFMLMCLYLALAASHAAFLICSYDLHLLATLSWRDAGADARAAAFARRAAAVAAIAARRGGGAGAAHLRKPAAAAAGEEAAVGLETRAEVETTAVAAAAVGAVAAGEEAAAGAGTATVAAAGAEAAALAAAARQGSARKSGGWQGPFWLHATAQVLATAFSLPVSLALVMLLAWNVRLVLRNMTTIEHHEGVRLALAAGGGKGGGSTAGRQGSSPRLTSSSMALAADEAADSAAAAAAVAAQGAVSSPPSQPRRPQFEPRAARQCRGGDHPYDLGWHGNLQAVFGEWEALWCLPLWHGAAGDGLSFPARVAAGAALHRGEQA